MSKFVLTKATILYGHLELRGEATSFDLPLEAEAKEVTTFDSDGWREFLQGLKAANFSLDALFSSDSVDERLFSVLADEPLIVTETKPTAAGDLAYATRTHRDSFNPRFEIGEARSYRAQLRTVSAVVRGNVLHVGSAISASGNSTAQQLGAVGAAQRAYAALVVTGVTGSPTLDVTVESDDAGAFSSPVTRITFDQATAVGSQWKSVDGAITDDYWRNAWTYGGTGDITFVSFFGIGAIR